jgi:hypothetical protein
MKVLEGFTHEERQMFLRFVYGQSRLPYNPADFTQKFELLSAPYATRGGANPDASTLSLLVDPLFYLSYCETWLTLYGLFRSAPQEPHLLLLAGAAALHDAGTRTPTCSTPLLLFPCAHLNVFARPCANVLMP